MGFLELLTLSFIILKLTGSIDWSWWWVLSPVISALACTVILAIVVIGDNR